MKRQMLRSAVVAPGFAAAMVAASLLAIGCSGASGTSVPASGGSNTTVKTTLSQTLPPPLDHRDRALSAGRQVLDLVALDTSHTGPAHLPKIVVTLPGGWSSYHGFALTKRQMGLAFWDVDKVYGTPCHWKSQAMVDPGTTVGGLAAALARQPLRHATAPANAVLAGVRGTYLRLSVPKHIDFASCDKGYFESWTGLAWATDRWEQGPGQVDRLWILDVHGRRLVVDANYLPSASANDRAELDHVVHSIRFLHDATPETGAANGRWIAYSSAPAGQPRGGSTDVLHGSDVFMTRAGDRPKLVAGRGNGTIWNLCPAFSPDGAMLAYARVAHRGSAILVVRVGRDGPIGAPRVVLGLSGGWARCPIWSSNGSRLAYLNKSRKVVVRRLDGTPADWAPGDPRVNDFVRGLRGVSSPTGGLIATLSNSGIVVSRPDGSQSRVIDDNPPSYAIGGWSPDGRKLLVVRDVGGGFTMRAVSVFPPFVSTAVVAYVVVNGGRSWPGYGDISWQPK